MPEKASAIESWRRMVLRSMPPPEWLSDEAPDCDVVLSSRVRVMRNLRGHRFPHHASTEERETIRREVLLAAERTCPDLRPMGSASPAEREYLVGCRLISPEFSWSEPGSALLMDSARRIALMVNEEDHIRLQALTPGWSLDQAKSLAKAALAKLEGALEFAKTDGLGYLAASPYNCGAGERRSAMLHLVALAHTGRLRKVLEALAARGLHARGLFGESSRAFGAFVQASATSGPREDFDGACLYLIGEERSARQSVAPERLSEKVEESFRFLQSSRSVVMENAVRALGWLRWGAAAMLPSVKVSARDVDRLLTSLELRTTSDRGRADRQRVEILREFFGL